MLTLPPQVGPDSQEDEDEEEEEAKEMGDHAEKHAGQSGKDHH